MQTQSESTGGNKQSRPLADIGEVRQAAALREVQQHQEEVSEAASKATLKE